MINVEKNKIKDKQNENKIEGKNAFIEAFNAKIDFKKIIVQKGFRDEKINKILNILKDKKVVIDFLDKESFDKMSDLKVNQGIIAIVDEYKYVEVSDILDYAKEQNEPPFILILDEIEDPHNFGAIIRTAVCMGVHGIIIKNRNQVQVTETVMKVSAGAANLIKIAKVINISNIIEYLKDNGVWIACADMDGIDVSKTNLSGSIALVLGNEGKGVGQLIRKNSDYIVKIPMKGNFDSLNVSVAAGMLMYEISKGR